MPDFTTQLLNLVKPQVGGSDGSWGGKTNDNWDKVDAGFARSVRAPTGETLPELPALADRASEVAMWTAAGALASVSAAALAALLGPSLIAVLGPEFKGDPGGNVMSLGLASNMANISVSAGTDLVATSGNVKSGVGPWWYSADPLVTTAGYSTFVDKSGRGFKMSRFAIPTAVASGALGISDINGPLVDETAYLQGLANAMRADCPTLPGKAGGGIQRLDPTLPIYINSQLDIPDGVSFRGEYKGGEILNHDPNTGGNPGKSTISLGSRASTWVLGPNALITLGDASYLDYVSVVGVGAARFISPKTRDSTIAEIQAVIDTYNDCSIAIQPRNGAADCGIRNCLIAGVGLSSNFIYNERYIFEHNKVDAINGFYQAQTYDYARCNHNEFYPFVWAHRLADGAGGQELLKNYGTGIKYGTGADTTRSIDGGSCCDNMVYGYNIGYDFQSPNGLLIEGNWADNDVSRSDTVNTIGFRTSGNGRRAKFIGNHSDSHGRGIDCQGGGSLWDMNTTAGCTVSHFRYGAGADIIGGLHFMQGPSPLYIEVTEGPGRVTWNQTAVSDWNGPLIALLGGGLPSAATRALIDLGKVVPTRNGVGASYDPRQWCSFVETGNPAGTISPITPNDYQHVSTVTLSNGSSPIDGYGEFRNGIFYATYDGFYFCRFTMEGGVSTADVNNVGGHALTQLQLRLDGIAQPGSQDIQYLDTGGDHTWHSSDVIFAKKGQAIDPQFYTTVPVTLAANKAVMTVIRLGA